MRPDSPTAQLDPTAPAAAAEPVPPPARGGWRRTRLGVYLAFACIAAHAGWQAWQTQRMAHGHAQESRLVAMASHHTTLSERLGRLAALISLNPETAARTADDLAAELAKSRDEALQLQQLSAQVLPLGSPAPDAAFDGWQDARERLWYRAEALLSHVGAGRARKGGGLGQQGKAVHRDSVG